MEGTFDFDSDGIAHAISAPGWTVEALRVVQGDLTVLESVLENPKVDDELAQKWVDEISQRVANQVAPALGAQIKAGILGKPRPAAARFVTRMLALIGAVMTLKEAGEWATNLAAPLVKQYLEQH